MVGDETVELWLKRGAGAWALEQSVAADTSNPPYQDFEIDGLESGLQHTAQIRVFRDGRYRAGYIGGDPEAWPEQSRIDFIPGAEAAPAPEIIAGEFERTSGVAHQVTLTITPNALALDLDLDILRDGVVVGTVPGPHVGDVEFIDEDPPIATAAFYTARHRQFTLNGVESDPFRQWIGPPAPTDLEQIGDMENWYGYEVQWTNVAGATRVRDDWHNTVPWTNRALLVSGESSFLIDGGLEKESPDDEGGPPDEVVLDGCTVEVRHEVSSFAVVDVSEWVDVGVTVLRAGNETAH